MILEDILRDLIAYKSVTPYDVGCQQYMLNILTDLGFRCETFDKDPVSNFYAEYGDSGPLLMFAGHTDVVPAGNEDEWLTDPFQLNLTDGKYYGRGVADMKGSLASMLIACQRFVNNHPQPQGRIGLLITSGEEGNDFLHGTPHVMQELAKRGTVADYCIVGEPSSTERVGDVIKNGRRGSLNGELQIHGVQGHVAYPHLAKNPVHLLAPALLELTSTNWDDGGEFFPPTSLQITRFHADSGAGNVIPGQLDVRFNFRFSVLQTAEKLQAAVEDCLQRHALSYTLNWSKSGDPFLTAKGKLIDVCRDVILEHTGREPELSTGGGTSDGRFIAPYGVELVELGPVNATIHKVNECVEAKDLDTLANLYYDICEGLL